jgi:sec-independent protein translocase protein TatA
LTLTLACPRISIRVISRDALFRATGEALKELIMPGKLGLPEILIILAVALLIFGPSKLADLGKGLGEGIKNFKSAVKDGGDSGTEKKS